MKLFLILFAIFAISVTKQEANRDLSAINENLTISHSPTLADDLYNTLMDIVRLEVVQQFQTNCQKFAECANQARYTELESIGCKKYYGSLTKLNFSAALDACARQGLQLVTLDNIVKYECLREEFKRSDRKKRYWTAASDEDEAQYVWKTTNEVANLTPFWKPTQPDGPPEHCAVFNSANFLYDDYRCSVDHYYICESP